MRAKRSYSLLHELLTYDPKLYLVEFTNDSLMQEFIDWAIAHYVQLVCSTQYLEKIESGYL